MIRHLVFIGLLLSICHPVIYCQQPDYIRGKVIDSKTYRPIPFATVRLKNSLVGVISNAEGDFRILNNPGFQSDSLIVSCIGFHRLSLAFSKLKLSEMNNLKLVPNIYSLNEVRVTARKKRLSPELIIARALRNIKKNNPAEPFSYVSYYRDYQKDSSNYLNLNEGIIQTLDKGFGYPSDSNRYRLLDFKKNKDFLSMNITPYYDIPETDHSDKSFKRISHATVGDQYGNEFFVLLAHNAIRNFNKKTFSYVDIFAVESYNLVDFDVYGDFAYLTGYSVSGKIKQSGEEFKDNGKFIDFFKRQPDGNWICTQSTWNSDNQTFDIHSQILDDFSGRWKLDLSKSINLPEIISSNLEIIQKGNNLNINGINEIKDKEPEKSSFNCTIGSEAQYKLKSGIFTTTSTLSSGRQTFTIKETLISEKSGSKQEYSRITIYTLMAKGEILSIISDATLPEEGSQLPKVKTHSEMVYTKL
jgi:hypothetical protein